MKCEPVETNILGPVLSSLLFENPDRREDQNFECEAEALHAILHGKVDTLPWYLDNRKTTILDTELVAGHIYGLPYDKGPKETPVMVIGKMPRPADVEDEDWEDFPRKVFHTKDSKAGEYFRDTAIEFGVDPTPWYVTYLFKCLHPKDPNRGTRIDAGWLKESFPILQYEITQVSPSYILIFGAEAVKALFGNSAKITKLTGTVLDYHYTDLHGNSRVAKCVCCTSPYAVVRSSDASEAANYRAAFKLFVDTLSGVETVDRTEHFVCRTLAEWKDLLRIIDDEIEGNLLAIDSEWSGDHPQNARFWLRSIQFSWKHGRAASVVFHDVNQQPMYSEAELAEIKKDFLEEVWTKRIICGHYFDSDAEMLVGCGFVPTIFDLPLIIDNPEDYKAATEQGFPCLFDTALAAHAYCETDDHSLTGQFLLRCPGVPRYDAPVEEWIVRYCKEKKIKRKELPGFGECPDDILFPYANYDADVTRRIAVFYIKNLHKDPYGLNCWPAFTNSMQQWPAFFEMNTTGIPVDQGRLDDLMDLYGREARRQIRRVRQDTIWPLFNINSHFHMREMLFGEDLNHAKTPGQIRPGGAKSLMCEPLYATDGTPWPKALKEEGDLAVPTTNIRTLSMLASYHQALFNQNKDRWGAWRAGVLTRLKAGKFLTKACSYVLKESEVLEDGTEVEKGLSAYICDDRRLRTHLYQTLDTGRASSSRPAMQNISKKREADYKKIVGGRYIGPLRSILCATDGGMLVWADFKGAELFAVAVLGNDETMLEHVQRNALDEDDPNFYDIHSEVAVQAFHLECDATKKGLASIGKSHFRIVAKSVIFGLAYGRGAAAIAEQVKEEGVFVTKEEVQSIIDGIKTMYPDAMAYLDAAANRVTTHGWISGVCKRYRRKPIHEYLPGDKLAELERIFKNFTCQNYVAESMRVALTNLHAYRFEHNVWYEILLQVHDECLLWVPYDQVERVVDEVLPWCMGDGVAFYARALDGAIDKSRGPYSMSIDITVGHRYGVGEKDWRDTCRKIVKRY